MRIGLLYYATGIGVLSFSDIILSFSRKTGVANQRPGGSISNASGAFP
jgi:hypothetical protein